MSRANILTDDAARAKFIDACMALKSEPIPGTPYAVYDYFPHWHVQAMNLNTPAGQMSRNAAHGGPSFGPWHRLLLLVFESLSRQVLSDQSFEVPYWDWAVDAATPAASPLWSLLGGDGDPSQNYAVTSGPFGSSEFRVNLTDGLSSNDPWRRVDPPRPLRRRFNFSEIPLASKSTVTDALDGFGFYERWPYNNNTSSFRRVLESSLHNVVHRFIGGDMMTSASPNDPVFFLHHCNIDRIWAAWQAQYPTAPYVPPDSAPETLFMHRVGDPMHNYFNITLPISAMVNYQDYYNYDSLA